MVDFGTKFAKVLPPGFQMPWNKGAVSTVEALKIRQQELLQVRHFYNHLKFSFSTTWRQNLELK